MKVNLIIIIIIIIIIIKLSHSMNAIGPAPHRGGNEGQSVSCGSCGSTQLLLLILLQLVPGFMGDIPAAPAFVHLSCQSPLIAEC
jgi:hypothetical protein